MNFCHQISVLKFHQSQNFDNCRVTIVDDLFKFGNIVKFGTIVEA